jgi:uncharacterized protein with PIN domain
MKQEQECCQEVSGGYLGTTCPKCNKPFRSVIQEPKQETLEEVAKNYSKGWGEYDDKKAFIEGAKWQQEQDKNKYSEEEVQNILIEYVKTNPTKPYRVVNWFEQFKKK